MTRLFISVTWIIIGTICLFAGELDMTWYCLILSAIWCPK